MLLQPAAAFAVQGDDRTNRPTALQQHFQRQARRRPHHPAIEFGDEVITYAELDLWSDNIADELMSRGVRRDDLVAIFLSKSPRLFSVILGILKAGAGYVPLDPKFPSARIQTIADDAAVRLIVSEGGLAESLEAGVTTELLRLDRGANEVLVPPTLTIEREIYAEIRHAAPSSENALCYVIYTSGSTGRPKGVMIEHRNALAFVQSLETVYRIGQDDRIYQGFSTAFDASVEEIWAAFSRGATLVVPTEDVARSPVDIAEFINRKSITFFSTVPTVLAMIDDELPTVTTLILGGEACSDELVARFARPGRRMLNTYGPTEATVVATWAECRVGEPVKIGVAIPGYTTFVLNDQRQPVAPGESGELYIGGAGVARGYMNLADMTAERFIANPFADDPNDRLYRTFDHVMVDEDGALRFLGRLDDQVKIRGFRIELSEIESVLVGHPSIQAAAVGVVEIENMKELAAYVVASDASKQIDREAIAELLRERVPSYMVPQYLDVVATLPVTNSGKIDRKNLPQPVTPLKGSGPIVAADGDVESQIAAIWAKSFKLPDVSVEADFFLDLGGHSLIAAQVVGRLRVDRPDVSISVRDVYECRTIRALAQCLNERAKLSGSAASNDNDNTPTHEDAVASVSPAQRRTTVAIQAIAALIYYGIIAAPLTFAALLAVSLLDGTIAWQRAFELATVVGFAAWPTMVLLSIAIKWLVIGRYKPGRYPLWSSYYLRWWVATRFQALSWSGMFVGTPLMALYWRAMGANIGRNVTICTPLAAAFDCLSIGDNTSIGLETQILGYRVQDGFLVIAPVAIGRDCFVGMHCSLDLNTSMGDGARLDDMSMLADGAHLRDSAQWAGSPARPARVHVPSEHCKTPSRTRVFLFGALHLVLIYVMGYVLIASTLPAFAIISYGLMNYGPLGAAVAALLAAPVGLVSYALIAIGLYRLMGRTRAHTIALHSTGYLHHWFKCFLIENTKTILLPVYATLFLPSVLRAFGAKIGRGSEISTVSHIVPELLDIGAGSFLADSCLVGGHRVHAGQVEVKAVRIGDRSFIGNSALVSGGHVIGRNVLIGVASTPPRGMRRVACDTRWLGSPSFKLPRTQIETCFNDAEIFKPSRAALIERGITDAARCLLPGLIVAAHSIVFVALVLASYSVLSMAAVVALTPLIAGALAFNLVLATAVVKRIAAGAVAPVVKPLWCRFIWRNELVNGVYESVAAPAMLPLMGTPFIATFLRIMGCRVGKACFIETTLFSEFDLVEIGDRACLNLGATIQTHLFEDRVFKADRLAIGDGANVGNMAVILYATQLHERSSIGPLSVLMKGETIPAGSRWQGIPCEHVTTGVASQNASLRAVSAVRREQRAVRDERISDMPEVIPA